MSELDPPLNLLAIAAFPELAAALHQRHAAITQRWEQIVREVLPKADELTFTQLLDDIPRVLNQIAASLQREGTRHLDDLLAMSEAHGSLRFHQSYKLNELLLEYDLLRPIVIEELVHEIKRRLTLEEVVAINTGIDISARRSVLVFVGHQQQELSAATESQSKYLSFLSHDLRGGLNGVFLMIEVLKRELGGEQRLASTIEDLDTMRRSLLETVATMDRFLHAERFRKGKVQVQNSRVDLKNLCNEIVAHFIYQAQEKGLKLESAVDANCVVTSDRELLSLVLQNLVSNAIKYTERGSVRVTGKTTAVGGTLLAVTDQGPGIEPGKLNELFAPFTRGQTYGQPGVGLGLSIARQAADLLQAKLWAESEPGKGSTFFLELQPEKAR
jgi:signal transduction histidine kinase